MGLWDNLYIHVLVVVLQLCKQLTAARICHYCMTIHEDEYCNWTTIVHKLSQARQVAMEMLPHVKLKQSYIKYDERNNPTLFEKGDFVWIYFPRSRYVA